MAFKTYDFHFCSRFIQLISCSWSHYFQAEIIGAINLLKTGPGDVRDSDTYQFYGYGYNMTIIGLPMLSIYFDKIKNISVD